MKLTLEEQVKSNTLAIQQLNRRMTSRRILAPLSPVVLSGFCFKPVGGVIAGAIMPISGYITTVMAYAERLPMRADGKLGFTLIVFFEGPDGMSGSKSFDIRQSNLAAITNIYVKAGTRICVTTPSEVENICYGIVFEPEMPSYTKIDVSDSIEDLAPVEREMLELPE